MKRLIGFCVAILMVVSLSACGGSSSKAPDIVMITDKGNIDDKSFNQGTYEGIKEYANENKQTYDYIKPVDATSEEYKNAVDQAVKKGAKIVVTPGFLFESAIYEKQTKYPDVKFILIDGYPTSEDGKTQKTAKNTVGIKFKEEQVGYLAGYAAVKDGNEKIAFLGGQAVPAVVNYGYGYLQGANDAAKELSINVEAKYYYSDGFAATPEAQTLSAGWYKDGVGIIFGCGGHIGNSAMTAAESSDPQGKVIGVDVDQNAESEMVVISARKGLANAVKQQLKAINNDSFQGGKNLLLGAPEDAVDLSMKTSKLKVFKQSDYDALYSRIKAGEIDIFNYEKEDDVAKLEFSNLRVDFIAK